MPNFINELLKRSHCSESGNTCRIYRVAERTVEISWNKVPSDADIDEITKFLFLATGLNLKINWEINRGILINHGTL